MSASSSVASEAGGQDQQTAHGRRAGLLLMGLRDVVADGLANMRAARNRSINIGPIASDNTRAVSPASTDRNVS